MANSTVQFNGVVNNIESNINKTDTYNPDLNKSASKQKYPSIECLKDLINQIFPVGMILSFDTDVDPNELYGGTWERIKGRFIWGIDDGETAGATGGEKTHTLTVEEMPSHSHYMFGTNVNTATNVENKDVYNYGEYTNVYNSIWAGSSGGNQPHNNMPPYYGAYTWRRVA